MIKLALRFALEITLLAAFALPAAAQIPRRDQAGQFDFYVLSLSWSPSFCAAASERAANRVPRLQCGARPYSFVVHGLWPQYDKGFPQFCQVPAPRIDRATVSSMLDLMPAPGLIVAEWRRHGTCSGLSSRAYFALVRKARAVVKIPPEYRDLRQALIMRPAVVEDAFVKTNPDLTRDDIAVMCSRKRLSEIRICLAKDLKFRGCPNIVKQSCRRDQMLMPPLRGSKTGADGSD